MNNFTSFTLIKYNQGDQKYCEFTLNNEILEKFLDRDTAGIEAVNIHIGMILRELLEFPEEVKANDPA